MKSNHLNIARGFTVLACLLQAGNVLAIDLQPGDIKAPPPGIDLMMLSYQHSDRGDHYVAGNKVQTSTSVQSDQLQLRYTHTFESFSMPSVVYVQTPRWAYCI